MNIKTVMLMARRRERLAQPRPRGDDFPVFSPREWADLPTYRPRTN